MKNAVLQRGNTVAQISSEKVYLSYENHSVVENLNFEVNKGDYFCIVGENGSGKSTLIKAILGLKSTAKGHLHFGDGLKSKEIGYMPQQTTLQKDFPASVYEVVLSGCITAKNGRIFFGKKLRKTAEENMKKLDVYDIRNKSFRELSGGQQQRVLLARAFCATKSLLLLDEPVTGLDPVATTEFYGLIERINKEYGITVVMVTHDLLSSLKYATHILHLKKTNSFFGTKNEYLLSETYNEFSGGTRK